MSRILIVLSYWRISVSKLGLPQCKMHFSTIYRQADDYHQNSLKNYLIYISSLYQLVGCLVVWWCNSYFIRWRQVAKFFSNLSLSEVFTSDTKTQQWTCAMPNSLWNRNGFHQQRLSSQPWSLLSLQRREAGSIRLKRVFNAITKNRNRSSTCEEPSHPFIKLSLLSLLLASASLLVTSHIAHSY